MYDTLNDDEYAQLVAQRRKAGSFGCFLRLESDVGWRWIDTGPWSNIRWLPHLAPPHRRNPPVHLCVSCTLQATTRYVIRVAYFVAVRKSDIFSAHSSALNAQVPQTSLRTTRESTGRIWARRRTGTNPRARATKLSGRRTSSRRTRNTRRVWTLRQEFGGPDAPVHDPRSQLTLQNVVASFKTPFSSPQVRTSRSRSRAPRRVCRRCLPQLQVCWLCCCWWLCTPRCHI